MKIEFVIDDILDELSLLDENEVETNVVISVADLQLLPKVMPEETLAISVVERLSILEEEMKEIKNGIFSNCPATRPKGEQQPQSKLQLSMQPPQNQRVTFGKAFEVSYSSITSTERFFRILDLQKSCAGAREHNPLSKTSHYTNMAEMVSGYSDEPFKEPRRKQRNKEGTAGAQASGGASKENCLLGGNETICIQLTNVNPKVTEANINDHVTLQGIDVCKVNVSDTSTDGWLTKRFQVTFPRDMTERVLSTDFWPPKETWLYDFELYKLSVNSSFRMNLIGKSGMDRDVIRCGRPSGGLAIITKESSKLSLSRIASLLTSSLAPPAMLESVLVPIPKSRKKSSALGNNLRCLAETLRTTPTGVADFKLNTGKDIITTKIKYSEDIVCAAYCILELRDMRLGYLSSALNCTECTALSFLLCTKPESS
ncbi:hypothetical protein CAPTEDRAFT_209651 [Capitella teleta]|uniref:Uncharacterized protein n=1 Tax=Capitella teleta TaxID=283909 RepID=R7TDM1_CAPTE|nr:hypothetical protein CAPTEDRAFT_209651 [Capitella teleta]|eukprot:ELT89597.1 hypothetical protein CAPTEDRAFT_209651 [Capitella teleta]